MPTKSRPPIWIGHVSLRTRTLDESEAFMKQLGMRGIFRGEEVAVLELRGGTHLILIDDREAEPALADFDFMVENIDAAHSDYRTRGFVVSEMSRGTIHDSFTLTEPGGNQIVVNSSHVPDHAAV